MACLSSLRLEFFFLATLLSLKAWGCRIRLIITVSIQDSMRKGSVALFWMSLSATEMWYRAVGMVEVGLEIPQHLQSGLGSQSVVMGFPSE